MRSMTTRPSYKLVALVVFVVFCALPSIAAAQVPQFESLYVFGDSLADNGNVLLQTKAMRMNPPVPPSVTPHPPDTRGSDRRDSGTAAGGFAWWPPGGWCDPTLAGGRQVDLKSQGASFTFVPPDPRLPHRAECSGPGRASLRKLQSTARSNIGSPWTRDAIGAP